MKKPQRHKESRAQQKARIEKAERELMQRGPFAPLFTGRVRVTKRLLKQIEQAKVNIGWGL